jgi:hypothetical protein
MHDQGSCGGDHTERKCQLIVPVGFSTCLGGKQFHYGRVNKNLLRFFVCIPIYADQCNVDLFLGAKKVRSQRPWATAY